MFRRVFTKLSWNVKQYQNRSYATYKRFGDGSSLDVVGRGRGRWNNNPQLLKIGGVVAVGSGIIYITNLKPAPISGRRRFLITSEAIENEIGKRTSQTLIEQYRSQILPINDPHTVKVRQIMQRIIEASDTSPERKKRDLEVFVINSSDPPNAFVTPDGKVFVFKSIMNLAANDDGLATVLSHEFAHHLARHNGEQLSSMPFYFMASLLIRGIIGSDTSTIGDLLINLGMKMPASREMEREADYIGLMLMSKACFEPKEAPKFWARFVQYEKKLQSQGQGKMFEYFSTHPSSEHRFEKLTSLLPEAEMQRELGNCDHNMSNWFNEFKQQQNPSSDKVFGIDTSRRSGSNGGLW